MIARIPTRLPALLSARLGLRGRIWLTVVAAVATVLLGLTAGFNLLIADRLSHDADNVASARASAELDAMHPSAGGIRLQETFDAGGLDTPTWVFSGSRTLEAPRMGGGAEALARSFTGRPRGFADLPSQDVRLFGLPVRFGSRRVGTVVAAVMLGPYEEIRRIALLLSSLLALLALVTVAAASRWLIARSLRPITEMTAQAAEWSERRLDRRFGLGEPHDEFTTLAATLDGLLDRVATSLRHEQNLTAELSHELRTPLTHVSTEAQYALRHYPGDAEQAQSFRRILDSARQMTRILETLMTAARAEASNPHARCDAAAAAAAAIEPMRGPAAEDGVQITLHDPPVPIRLPLDSGVVERILGPLLENACRFATHHVTVQVAPRDRFVVFIVTDDGPGIAAEHAESVFEPGFRAAPSGVALLTGAGLGLPLARRLSRNLGGDVTVGHGRDGDEEPGEDSDGDDAGADDGGGARIVVELPRE